MRPARRSRPAGQTTSETSTAATGTDGGGGRTLRPWAVVLPAAVTLALAAGLAPATSSESAPVVSTTTEGITDAGQRDARRGAAASTRIATLNLPGSERRPHARLLPQPRRTTKALGEMNRAGVSVVAIQELSSPSRKAIRASDNWRVVSAPHNSTRGRSTIGNGVAFRIDQWHLQSQGHLHLPVAHRPNGLNMAVATLRKRGTDKRLVVVSVHHPQRSEKRAIRVRERAKQMEITFANRTRRATGYPVVIAGDLNQRDGFGPYRRGGYHLGIRWAPDVIGGRGLDLTDPRAYVDGVRGRVTDHALVTVRATIRR